MPQKTLKLLPSTRIAPPPVKQWQATSSNVRDVKQPRSYASPPRRTSPMRGHIFPWIGFRRRKPNLPGTHERLGAPALGFGILRTPPTRYPPARHLRLSLEQPSLISSKARMAAENGRFEIVRHASLPAPAQSAESPNVYWVSAKSCQFRRHPLVGVFGADADVARRNDEDRAAAARPAADRFHRRDSPPARGLRKEKTAHPRRAPRQFPSDARAAPWPSSTAACRSEQPLHRSIPRPIRARPEFAFLDTRKRTHGSRLLLESR